MDKLLFKPYFIIEFTQINMDKWPEIKIYTF